MQSTPPLDVRAGYDVWSAIYDDHDPTTAVDEPLVRELGRPYEGRRVLDLGCGTGRYSRLVAAEGARPVGIDLSRGMLARARRTTRAPFVQGSVAALPFADAGFDRVVSGLVVDHLPDLAPFYGELVRVLAPGGRAIVTAVHPELQRVNQIDPTFEHEGRTYRVPGVMHSTDELVAAARAAGLSIVERHEPRIDDALAARRRGWRAFIGVPAFFILVADKLR